MSQTPLRAGKIVDNRFVLKRRLGSGGVGAVWLALDRAQNDQAIALKILHPRLSRDPGAIGQLGREASVLAQLNHPNITKPFLFEPEGEFIYLGMEFINGRPLHEELGERAKSGMHFDGPELEKIFGELCSALSYAHSQNIVHRDLKPHNVMIVGEGERMTTKVLDFGIARLLEGSVFDATTLGRQIGSLFYMAPEQARGEPADTRTDVFGIGCVLFEMLTLRRAWAWDDKQRPLPAFSEPLPNTPSNSIAAVLNRLSTAQRLKVSDLRPGLPPDLDTVLARAMAINAEARFQSIAELQAETSPLFRLIEDEVDRTVAASPAGAPSSMLDDKTEVPGLHAFHDASQGTGTRPYEGPVDDIGPSTAGMIPLDIKGPSSGPMGVEDSTALDIEEPISGTLDYQPSSDHSDATSVGDVNELAPGLNLEEAGPTTRAESPLQKVPDPELYNTTAMSMAAQVPELSDTSLPPIPVGFSVPTSVDEDPSLPIEVVAPQAMSGPIESVPTRPSPPHSGPAQQAQGASYPARAQTAVGDTGPVPKAQPPSSGVRRHINLLMVVCAGVFCGLAGVLGTIWVTQRSDATITIPPPPEQPPPPKEPPKAPPPKIAGRYQELESMLVALKKKPTNLALITELQKRISAEADTLQDTQEATPAQADRGAQRAGQKRRRSGKLHRATQNRQS